jgi:hypothetical protein
MCAAFSFRRLKEPNSTADRYVNGHGMSLGLEDQKPQPKPPSFPPGLFFLAALISLPSSLGSKMETPKKRQKYTAKHINEITDRMTALRVRWLRHVKTQLASQQSRPTPALDHYKVRTQAAE